MGWDMGITKKEVYFIKVIDAVDTNTEEGQLAWDEATDHHCIPFVKDGIYQLTRFWSAYSDDPYENLEVCKEDWGGSWKHQGMLFKVIADYVRKQDPEFYEWDKIYLDFRW